MKVGKAPQFRFGAIGWRQSWNRGVGGEVRKWGLNAKRVPRNSAKIQKYMKRVVDAVAELHIIAS